MGWLDKYVHWWARTAFWPLYLKWGMQQPKQQSRSWRAVAKLDRDRVWTSRHGWIPVDTFLYFDLTTEEYFVASELYYKDEMLFARTPCMEPYIESAYKPLVEQTKNGVCKRLYTREKLFEEFKL